MDPRFVGLHLRIVKSLGTNRTLLRFLPSLNDLVFM